MCDQLYKLPAKLKKHTDDLGLFFGALGFTSLVEQLALRVVPAESLLTWLTTPTGPHLMEVVLTSESHTAMAILVTLEELYDSYAPRVGLGLVYKAPYIKTASFSEAFFYLKSVSEAEAHKRITDSHLMFVWINKASKVIPLPYVQPLFLDVRRKHESSQASQVNKSQATSSQPLLTPTLGAHEVREIVRDTLDQVYAIRLKTFQEMSFIWEVDRALAKSIMVEFLTSAHSRR